jgi:thymidylate synthase
MFKFAALVRCDGAYINPFACSRLRSYLRGEVAVMNRSSFDAMRDGIRHYGGDRLTIVVIGDGPSIPGVYLAADIRACIKHLSATHHDKSWWMVGDNAMANDFILKGLIMDVYIAEISDRPNTQNWVMYDRHVLHQTEVVDIKSICQPDIGFAMVSRSLEGFKDPKMVKHFMRRNIEEARLLHTMHEILANGKQRPNRTGIDTKSLFGKSFEYRLIERIDTITGVSSFRFPLLTTKHVFQKSVFAELLWFMRGRTDSKLLERQGVNIWKGNTSREFLDSVGLDYPEGEGGPIYPHQFRHSGAEWSANKNDYTNQGVDQVANVVQSLQDDPFGRRHVINLWAPSQLDQMCLPPCHILYIFYVHEVDGQKYLSLSMTQRSADTFLGLPFNVSSCSMLLMMMAHRVGMKPHTFVHNVTDCHIYRNHFEVSTIQTTREPCMFPYATITCDPSTNLEDYTLSDFQIDNYYHHNKLSAPMAA